MKSPEFAIPGVAPQRLWQTTGENRGIPLGRQLIEYAESFRPFGADIKLKIDPQNKLDLIKREEQLVHKATSVAELQDALIIYNANEFRLRDTPSIQEYEAIVTDFRTWELRPQASHFLGGEASRAKVEKELDRVLQVARERFAQLSQS